MPIKTTYICDKCAYEQDTKEQMWNIGILVKSLELPHSNVAPRGNLPKVQALYCRKCVQVLGLLPSPEPEPGKPKPEPPTFEEMIREIVQDEISAGD